MSNYRFHLQKYQRGSKTACPKCERKVCFTRYVDEQQEVTFPEYVGKCDHENSCGYHYTPKDFFNENPDVKKKAYSLNSNPVIIAPKVVPTSYIDEEIMKKTLTAYHLNPLYKYLCRVFGQKATVELMTRYNVGTSQKWGGSTIFWQVDIDGKIRTGKVMCYDSKTGHRIKEPMARVSWAHAELELPDFNLKQCFFGEHLLSTLPNHPVCIVESEKSAIIASLFISGCVWIASGGKHGCWNSKSIEALRGRDVTLIPDLGATSFWKEKQSLLKPICHSVHLFYQLELEATEEQKREGLDVADFLLMQPTVQMILQMMIEKNPELQRLIDDLDLELVDAYQLPDTSQIVQDNKNEGTCSGS